VSPCQLQRSVGEPLIRGTDPERILRNTSFLIWTRKFRWRDLLDLLQLTTGAERRVPSAEISMLVSGSGVPLSLARLDLGFNPQGHQAICVSISKTCCSAVQISNMTPIRNNTNTHTHLGSWATTGGRREVQAAHVWSRACEAGLTEECLKRNLLLITSART